MAGLTRRELLVAGAAPLTTGWAAEKQPRLLLCAFSKHFQWTDIAGAAGLARELGYDALDLTVRRGGHVLPERVADDLPKAAETIAEAGLKLGMVTTEIVDAQTKHAESVLQTLVRVGARRYRWGGFKYDLQRSLPAQLTEVRARVKDLAALNKQYGVCAMYHTHSGPAQVGASMWDLFRLLEGLDTEAVSVNYDIGHATVEGGYGGWIHSARLLLPYSRGIAVKDFRWIQNEKGAWVPGWRPLGDGMVNLRDFFTLLKQSDFAGPLQLHMEYPELGTAAHGRSTSSEPKERVLALMRQDITRLKELLRRAELV